MGNFSPSSYFMQAFPRLPSSTDLLIPSTLELPPMKVRTKTRCSGQVRIPCSSNYQSGQHNRPSPKRPFSRLGPARSRLGSLTQMSAISPAFLAAPLILGG